MVKIFFTRSVLFVPVLLKEILNLVFFYELVLSILQVVLHSGRVSHQSGSSNGMYQFATFVLAEVVTL